MNKLASALADRIRAKIGAVTGEEIRLVFLGPPQELMSQVYDDLTATPSSDAAGIPFLLQVPRELLRDGNPAVGSSGWCDEGHLLVLRNSPASSKFVGLVPPGEHSILSVDSTTDKFGVAAGNNGGNATFESWWDDAFIQGLVSDGLAAAGVPDGEIEDGRTLVEAAARAADAVETGITPREGAWRLLSRIFSIDPTSELKPGVAVCLACGFPPMRNGGLSGKAQTGALKSVADAMSEGFRRGVERASESVGPEDEANLAAFLDHVQQRCEVATSFQRATAAYYRPGGELELPEVPAWWTELDVEKWTELLSDDPVAAGDIAMSCVNALADMGKAVPAIVLGHVDFKFETKGGDPSGAEIEVNRTPAAGNGLIGKVAADSDDSLSDAEPPSHKLPLTYRATADGFKPGSMKVISLDTWQAGVVVAARRLQKFSAPRKPAKGGGRDSSSWESSLSFPGPGRYELLVFVSPGVTLASSGSLSADQTDTSTAAPTDVVLRQATPYMYRAEIEAEGNCQFDLAFTRDQNGSPGPRETCRTFITCEDVPEVSCRSVFERLIKANRRQLETFDARAEIPVNRAVRSTMFQDWILSPDLVRISFQPVIMAEDYGDFWSPPAWGDGHGPILSKGAFAQDPRPAPSEFNPPEDFLAAREEIARKVRGDADQSGVFETARLGEWALRDEQFAMQVERYVDAYQAWLASDPQVACWADVIAITSLDTSGRKVSSVPVAILLSPMHPLRVGWHVIAQRVLAEADEAGKPCPAASVLDPDCVPDILSLYLRTPSGSQQVDYIAVENGTDYWSVLWNAQELETLPKRSLEAPFGETFGISVGGISVGFSAAQVVRALDDVSDLLAAKSTVAVAISSAGGTTDACNEGLVEWCTGRFEEDAKRPRSRAVGPRFVEVFDDRPPGVRPDDATISNLSEDTDNSVRWYFRQPEGAVPDLGIIAQLDMTDPQGTAVEGRTPLGVGGLLRHRIRRQLLGTFLSETRQSSTSEPSGDVLADKVAGALSALENLGEARSGLRFSPNAHEVRHMLSVRRTDFVAVSSSAIDPACFLGNWLEGAYLWDFDLPPYSHRAGDTNGYYLLSQVTAADRDALAQALSRLPGCDNLPTEVVQEVLLEVARRGIPTIKGLAGDDAGATGDLGVFVAVRLLQDRFRKGKDHGGSLLPVIGGTVDEAKIAIVVPVDPFKGYISDMTRSLGREKGDLTQLRPDLLVVGVDFSGGKVRIKITPIEVKCRPTSHFSAPDSMEALDQAKALASLFLRMQQPGLPRLWSLAYQHLLLSIIGFGLRVYSQHEDVIGNGGIWSEFHERIARAILDGTSCVEIDPRGRLVVIDDSPSSKPIDHDNDGFEETIVIGKEDGGRIVSDDPTAFYDMVRARLDDWQLMPSEVIDPVASAEQPGPDAPVDPGDGTPGPTPVEDTTKDQDVAPPAAPTETKAQPVAQDDELVSTGVILQVGKTIDGFRPRDLQLNISDTRLNQLNIGVVGDLGTGKTQLLKSLIAQIVSSGPGNRGKSPRFLIFDYKRDYSTEEFVAATGARVVRPHRIPLNLFDTRTSGDVPKPWFDRYRFFADVLGKIYSGIGNVQRDNLKRAVKEAYESTSPGVPTLRDVHSAYQVIVDGKPDSPMGIIGDMLDMEIFEEDTSRTVPFDEFLDGVVVIALDALGQDDHSKNMLVAVMLNMFYENMLKTTKLPFIGHDPQLRAIDSYLLVDEADNIMRYEFDVLRKLLLQGREFGTGIILASQYLRHFKAGGTDYREPLLTWFIHKVPNINKIELSALGLSESAADTAERIKTLGNHQCLYKSFDSPGEFIRGYPFYELVKNRDGLK